MTINPSGPHGVRSAALVVNTASRRGSEALATAGPALIAAGFDPLHAFPVTRGAELEEALVAALETRPDVLVVGGGDGTVGATAALVAGTETVLGVLPIGTANDFARTLQIPTDPAAAVAALVEGHVVDVDLGYADERVFLNVASIGLATAVTERLTPRLKRRLGSLAYPVAALAAYRVHLPFGARLEFPDGDHPPLELEDLLQVAVGNGVHYGGGNTVSPDSSIDDHTLDVYAIVRGRMRDHVSIARLFRSGRFVEHERVHHLTTRRVTVTTSEPLPVNLDGELGAITPTTFTVERNALHVLVPTTSSGAAWDGAAARHLG